MDTAKSMKIFGTTFFNLKGKIYKIIIFPEMELYAEEIGNQTLFVVNYCLKLLET